MEEKKVTASQAISIQQPKKRAAKATLSIASEIDFFQGQQDVFLESVARNSRNSKASYEIGLKQLWRFLAPSSSNYYYKNYNVETILSSLKTGSANIYTSCWTALYSILSSCPMSRLLRPNSITLYYTYAVRSYLQYHDVDVNLAKFRRRVRLPKKSPGRTSSL